MQTLNDFKNYKKYYPNYAEWKLERNLAEAKRAEYLNKNPNEIKQEDIQKSKAILRAIDVMDEYSQKRSEDMEIATEEVVGWGSTLAMFIGGAIGALFKNNKALLNICSKFVKNEKMIPEIAKMVAASGGGLLALTAASFPLFSWAAKAETKAARKGRLEAMHKELNDPKLFATLTTEQEEEMNKNLSSLIEEKNKKKPLRNFKESLKTVKEMVIDSKEYLEHKKDFETEISKDKECFDKNLTKEEIDDAKKDQQLLTKLVEKIDIASQDYAENAELATSAITTSVFAFSALFNLLYEKIAQSLKWKKSAVPMGLGTALTLGATIWGTTIQKEASRVGRFKIKQDLLKNPSQLVYIPDEKTNNINDVQINIENKKGFFKFIKEALKNNKEYKKWKKEEGAKEKKISQALENIEITKEQLEDAKRLQYNTFKTFNKVDEKSQKYAESIEALGQSIQVPIVQLLSFIGIAVGGKYLAKTFSSKLPTEKTINYLKYIMTVIGFTIPSIGINAYITKEQKKASRVANMLAINEMQDYRNFADYSKYKNKQITN